MRGVGRSHDKATARHSAGKTDRVPLLPTATELKKQIAEYRKNRKPDKNSALYWLPKLKDLPIPRTEIVRFDDQTMWPFFDGESTPDIPWDQFKKACDIIGYPVFIRCDAASAKHYGPLAYRLDKWETAPFFQTFEFNVLVDREVFAFLFREWLNLEGYFTAFGSTKKPGHLIANEWRFLATSEKVIRQFFYWPDEAIEGYTQENNWRILRNKMRDSITTNDRYLLSQFATRSVGLVNKGEKEQPEWSVDFAKSKNGKWWLIDMALASNSWKANNDD